MSLAKLFTIGCLLLVSPVVIVAIQSWTCTDSGSYCIGSVSKFGDTFFPYVMITGGLLIGYGMKKFADTHTQRSEEIDDSNSKS